MKPLRSRVELAFAMHAELRLRSLFHRQDKSDDHADQQANEKTEHHSSLLSALRLDDTRLEYGARPVARLKNHVTRDHEQYGAKEFSQRIPSPATALGPIRFGDRDSTLRHGRDLRAVTIVRPASRFAAVEVCGNA
jgi:hypothetical protein